MYSDDWHVCLELDSRNYTCHFHFVLTFKFDVILQCLLRHVTRVLDEVYLIIVLLTLHV